MRTHHDWDGHNAYGHHAFDYRYLRPPLRCLCLCLIINASRSAHYPTPRHKAHPLDTSVMTYKGHAVLRTLIRCHFSPAESTGSSYIYSGSYDGKIHVSVSNRTLRAASLKERALGLVTGRTGCASLRSLEVVAHHFPSIRTRI